MILLPPRLAALALFAALASCRRSEPAAHGGAAQTQPAADAQAAAAPSAATTPNAVPDPAAPTAPPPDEDEVRPNYGKGAGPAEPLAFKACAALQALPAHRRAACCGGGGPLAAIVSECERIVSGAVRGKAMKVDEAAVDRCAAAMERSHQGCDWVGPFDVPIPPECQHLFTGTVAARGACRSSLECAKGLRCIGVGPTSVGVCGAPLRSGVPCLTGVDPLAVYARQDLDDDHPECAGVCNHLRCAERFAKGAACNTSRECAAGLHCAAGKCAEGAIAAVGQPCSTGACGPGTRCVKGVCKEPLAAGAQCVADEECRGGCVAGDGGKQCGMACR